MADINASIDGETISSEALTVGAALGDGIVLTLNGRMAHLAIAVGAAGALSGIVLDTKTCATDSFRAYATDAEVESKAGTGPIRAVNPEVAGAAAKDTAAGKTVALWIGAGCYAIRFRAKRATADTTISVKGTAFRQRVVRLGEVQD